MSTISETTRAEIAMHAVRLMRNGNIRTAKAIIDAVCEDFPDVTKDEIKSAIADIARKLLRSEWP